MPDRASGDENFRSFEAEAMPHWPALYKTARSLLGSGEAAEDAVQETYLQAFRCFHRFTAGTNCRAWLYSILMNVVRHQRRKWVFRFRQAEDEQVFERMEAPAPPPAATVTDGEILAALRRIPQKYAEVVILADVEELSYKEIEAALGIPIGTVMSRLNRGRKALREILAGPAAQLGIGLKTHAAAN